MHRVRIVNRKVKRDDLSCRIPNVPGTLYAATNHQLALHVKTCLMSILAAKGCSAQGAVLNDFADGSVRKLICRHRDLAVDTVALQLRVGFVVFR